MEGMFIIGAPVCLATIWPSGGGEKPISNGAGTEQLRRCKEALEEILTLHSINPIESMFATVGESEGNLKRYRGSRMAQRWLGAVLLHCEQGFKRVKGYAAIRTWWQLLRQSRQKVGS